MERVRIGATVLTGAALLALGGSVPGPSPVPEVTLGFEENRGQADSSVAYQARGQGYQVRLTAGAVLVATPGGTVEVRAVSGVLGQPRAEGALPGRVNYLLGPDPANWRIDIPTWARVRYREAFRGIDLVCHGHRHQLEYDLEVRPGADPQTIALNYGGTRQLKVDATGNLQVRLKQGQLTQPPPVAYQVIRGRRREVPVRYRVRGRELAFTVSEYDRTRVLTIDPIVYSTYLGGSVVDEVLGVAVDGSGQVHVAGYTTSSNFPTTAGALQSAPGGGEECFISKLSSGGTSLVYSTYLGGSGADRVTAVAVDASGQATVTGATTSPNFPLKGAFQTSVGGAFVTRLNSSGNALIYSSYLGGGGSTRPRGLALDSSGNAYVTGESDSPNFPVFNPFQAAPGSFLDAFLTKISANGSTLVYSTWLGGNGADSGSSVAVDSQGQATVTGYTTSSNFPLKNPLQASRAGAEEAFVSRFSPAGNALIYSTYLGGRGDDEGLGVALDLGGNACVAGYTESADFPLSNPLKSTLGGLADAFVTRLNNTGSGLLYSTYLGGMLTDRGLALAGDTSGNCVVVGSTGSLDFPTLNAFQPAQAGLGDGFVSRLTATGTLVDSTFLGGSGTDRATCVALTPDGAACVGGVTASSNFPTANALQSSLAGGGADGFVARISPGLPGASPSPTGSPAGLTLSLRTGWNPVGFRVASVTTIAPNSAVAGVATFNGASYDLASLSPAAVNPTTRGYFVFAQAPTSVGYSGSVAGSSGSLLLASGWNLVAFPVPSSLAGSALRTTRAGASVPLTSVLLPQFYENRSDGSQVVVDVSAGGVLAGAAAYWVFSGQSGVTLSYGL